jgi:hypothetical protein
VASKIYGTERVRRGERKKERKKEREKEFEQAGKRVST